MPMDDTREQVILVDASDRETGVADKLDCHARALLHRAFSVIIWNSKGEILLQHRAFEKYHSGGLWTNACCGHPRPREEVGSAAARRLMEEMGFGVVLSHLGTFHYAAALDRGMSENELVHVFRGLYDGPVTPDPAEALDYKWSSLAALRDEIAADPARFTVWFAKYVNADWPMALAPAA